MYDPDGIRGFSRKCKYEIGTINESLSLNKVPQKNFVGSPFTKYILFRYST